MPAIHSVERGDGKPILILHGGGLDHRHMLDAIEPVFDTRAGFRRVYIDLPGHGRSDGSAIKTQDDVLSAVSAFCKETFDRPFALIGESRGSLIARGLLAIAPERVTGACLVVPGGDAATPRKPEHRTLVPTPSIRDELPPAAQSRFDRMVVQSADIA